MDRQGHDYAANASAMTYAQQQQQRPGANMQQQQQQFGYHPQLQQYPPHPFMPPHPSMQQFPYPHHLPQQPPPSQIHPHLPPHPTLLHQQQPPPTFPPHLPPHLLPSPFHAGYEAPPPHALPPNDPELQKRIDKLVEYAAKNGPEFEHMIREKQQDNPDYGFLFGGEGHNYYRYKFWLSLHPPGGPFNAPTPFPPSSMPMMHPPNSMINPAIVSAQMHQPPFQPFYDPQQLHHQHPVAFGVHGRPDFDQSSMSFKGPLPPELALELTNVLNSLNGTKESIKGAKIWFMQRSPFAPALAEALNERLFALDDAERQLHIIYLANDILFEG